MMHMQRPVAKIGPGGWPVATVFRSMALCLLFVGGRAGAAAPGIDGHFVLSAADGVKVTEHSYHGKWQLIYFGYASCPDVCSTVMREVADALAEIGPAAAQVQPLFITLDPAHDTPSTLAKYLSQFDGRIIGLSGSARQVSDAAQAFRMYVKNSGLAEGQYKIEHSSFLFLLKPDGRFATLLSGNAAGHALASELRKRLQ